ncbi:AMP-binding protein [Blattabacterium cuenoti]|uniref:AMP-binding protein n=1 Tax=Blattabacterium cuenoti TaxID=1653831 RepID=UPI00163BC58D|nr:AMP-binding protein [Blattabacterium cuenoti]
MWIDFSNKKIIFPKNDSIWSNSIKSFLNDWNDNNSVIEIKTSGTTGNCKKIFLKKKYIIQRAIESVKYLKLNKKNIIGLLCLSPNFIASKMFLIRSMIFKWKILCIPPSYNPLKNIKIYNFDIASMIPMQVFFSIKYLKKIKNILIGGYSISNYLINKLKNISSTNFYATYGMTETYGHIALCKINNNIDNYYFRLLKNINIKIDKRNCLIVNFPKMNNIFIKTNDIVHLKNNNTFKWIGRYDNIINTGGIKVIPEQLENIISNFIPYNKRFFISSIPDKIIGEKIILIIEGSFFKIKIPERLFKGEKKYLKPKIIFFIKNFEENFLGKIRKKNITKKIMKKYKY